MIIRLFPASFSIHDLPFGSRGKSIPVGCDSSMAKRSPGEVVEFQSCVPTAGFLSAEFLIDTADRTIEIVSQWGRGSDRNIFSDVVNVSLSSS